MVNRPILITTDVEWQLKLVIHVSVVGEGTVLYHEALVNVDKLITYCAKEFDKHQRNILLSKKNVWH